VEERAALRLFDDAPRRRRCARRRQPAKDSRSANAGCNTCGKTWDFHVTQALKISLDENLRMIEESVRYVREQGRRVFYDCEHFFDGFRANREYSLKTLEAAAEWRRRNLVLCDTNGGSLPEWVAECVNTCSAN
jgi:isopropylmalate/homocitrate/citramalate synthase